MFRAVDPLAPYAKDRQPMWKDDGGAMAVDRVGGNAWVMVHAGDVREKSSATSSRAAEATIKQDEPDEAVAVPTPIGCWKVISPEGREERVFGPIPGFEHLCNGPAESQGVTCLADSPKTIPTPAYQTAVAQVPAKSGDTQPKSRKRTRSRAEESRQGAAQHCSEDGDDEQYDDRDVPVATQKSYTFYIGDMKPLMGFFHRRLDELTMKPVRPIVTAWVKQLEPKRLSLYGPYHKKLPSEQSPECTPPWWPHDVPYEEPSHLDKAGLLKLAVDLMLQHRKIDEAKRRSPWVAKLKHAAQYAVETTPPDQFSSSKGSRFSERMQGRALSEILPNLFDIAQLYENHIFNYNLFEGTNNQDPRRGTHVTWQPLTRPPRQQPVPRKRFRRARATPPPRIESYADVSGNETEVDNTATESHLPREEKAQQPQTSEQQVKAPIRGPEVSQPQHMHSCSSTTTPNISFGQSMYSLHLDEGMDLDVKAANHDQTGSQCDFQCRQPTHYCTSHSGYHHVPQPRQVPGSSNVVPVSTPAYHQPFTIFDAPYYNQGESSAFSSNTGYPYEYDMFVPSFFDGLPHLSSIGCESEGSHHQSPAT
ncbi:hypothetical protein J4E91_007699 [Alternaria rosae]|nr:hypothetical protein J4E91_007699 [Alternaria rosae]